MRKPVGDSVDAILPFFSGGIDGIIAAMGVTFISLQGFEMVSAIAGEVKDPQRTIPRAVFGLARHLVRDLHAAADPRRDRGRRRPARRSRSSPPRMPTPSSRVPRGSFLGEPGYWAVVAAIALATLSALQANLLTASRVAYAMARDHTLPSVLEREHPTRGTPIMAIYATALATVAIMFMLPDLSSAGAAASLIFLLAFALTHFTAYLARKRAAQVAPGGYATPWFPVVPIVGGVACAGSACSRRSSSPMPAASC